MHSILKGKTILVADDQSFILKIISFNLKKLGFNVLEAKNGAEEYKIAKEKKPDLILTDVMMPVMTGFEAIKKLKADIDTKDIPVMILSALSQKKQVVEAIKLGAIDYITKPFNLDLAKKKILLALQKKQTKQEYKQLDTFPYFYKDMFLIVKTDNSFIELNFIKKIVNTVKNVKHQVTNLIIDFSDNVKLDMNNLTFIDALVNKMEKENISISFFINKEKCANVFVELKSKLYTVSDKMEHLLPKDISVETLDFQELTEENFKYSMPVNFKNKIPVLDFYVSPKIEEIENIEKLCKELQLHHKNRFIIDFHNVESIPARIIGILVKQQINFSKDNGKIIFVILNPKLIEQLKEGGFISKFDIYSEFDIALNKINL